MLLDRRSDRQALLVSDSRAGDPVDYAGRLLEGASPADGEGMFFGFIQQTPASAREGAPDIFEEARRVEAAFLDIARKTVVPLGRQILVPGHVSISDAADLALFRHGEPIFDAKGSLYELCWTPVSLKCLKYAVRDDVMAERLASAGARMS